VQEISKSLDNVPESLGSLHDVLIASPPPKDRHHTAPWHSPESLKKKCVWPYEKILFLSSHQKQGGKGKETNKRDGKELVSACLF
jgi:hypothetical protein